MAFSEDGSPPKEDDWDEPILSTIFHEYIHYFESFLPQQDQPLRGREHGDESVRIVTVEEATRLDRRYVVKRAIFWGILAVLVSVIVLGFLGNRVPTFEEDATLDALRGETGSARED